MNRRFTIASLIGAAAAMFLPKTIGAGSKVKMTKQFVADLKANKIVTEGHPFKRDLLIAENDVGVVANATGEKLDGFLVSFPSVDYHFNKMNKKPGEDFKTHWHFLLKPEWIELV